MVGTGLSVGGAARVRHNHRLHPGDQVLLPRPHPRLPSVQRPLRATEEELDAREAEGLPVADYTIGTDFIFISVGWSDANALVKIVGQMAWTLRLAVAYISEDGSIFRP